MVIMVSPRRYLTLLQTLVDLDPAIFQVILPYLEPNVKEAIYASIYSVRVSNKVEASVKKELSAILKDKAHAIQYLAVKTNNKKKKRRILSDIAPEVRLILATAIPLIIISSPSMKRAS